jgi:hypothetical protein
MTSTSRLRTIRRLGGVAAASAPSVRRLASDETLRDDIADFIRSANSLTTHLRSDRRLRRDVRRLLGSARSGAGHLQGDVRPRHLLRNLIIGTGLMVGSLVAGLAVAWPRTRRPITRVAGQGGSRATVAVHDIRERIAADRTSESRAA